MKVVVACEFPESALRDLTSLGAELVYVPDCSADRLGELIRDAAILIVGRLRVSGETIHDARKLQMIVRAGTDPINIAIEEASAQGVFVCNCPDRAATAVAEYALGMLIALDRGYSDAPATARGAKRDAAAAPVGFGMAGRTLGLLGLGPMGVALAARARAFDMSILVWAQTLVPERSDRAFITVCASPRELMRRSDFVVIYAPSREGDSQVLTAELLEAAREDSRLVFIGAPGRIDLPALSSAIEKRRLRVGIDFQTIESAVESSVSRPDLQSLPTVLSSLRGSDQTLQAREAIALEAIRVIRRFLVSGEVVNCVNLVERSPATWQLVLRLRDAVGVMASVMDVIRSDGINAEEIATRVFSGARAAWCTVALDERPSMEALDSIRALEGVIHLELRAVV